MDSKAPLVLVPTRPLSTTLEEDIKRARHYADRARAANTNKAYEADWKRFAAWCTKRGQIPETARPSAVAAFLAWLAEQPREEPRTGTIALPTVLRAYAGIAKHFRRMNVNGWAGRGRPVEIAEVIDGLQREITHVPNPKAAITEKELRAMLAQLPPTLAGTRNRALVLVGFFGAFRRAPLVALNVSDLRFVEGKGLIIRIRRDKTDQKGKGRSIAMRFSPTTGFCPVVALKEWLDAGNIIEGPIFRPFSRTGTVLKRRLTPEMVAEVVKRLATKAGLGPERFAGHSLRAGFVTDAHRKGKSIPAIMKQTGHVKTDTVLRYIREEDVFEDNATEGLI